MKRIGRTHNTNFYQEIPFEQQADLFLVLLIRCTFSNLSVSHSIMLW